MSAEKIREKIKKLETALLEGKISEQTYRELKEKYEAELAEIGEAQEGRAPKSIEETLRRGVDLVNSYLRKIDPSFGQLKLEPGASVADLAIEHRGINIVVNVGVEQGDVVTVTMFAPMFRDPQGVKDKDLARLYRTLLRLNASTFTLSGTVNFGVMGAERGFIAIMWSKPVDFLEFSEFKYLLDLLSEKCSMMIPGLVREFGFLGE